MSEGPALNQLMGAYLHQDYDLFGDTPIDAVRTFLRDEPNMAQPLVGEIEFVLRSTPSESEVEELLRELGCQIRVEPELGYRGLLARIAEIARRPLSGPTSAGGT